MTERLERYRQVDYRLPETYLSWDLFGAGLDNLGRDGQAVELPLADPKPDEVLLRVDALGLCFSDTKLIWAGPEHPRIRGRDLRSNPTVAGHEAAMTVVGVGSDWKSRFSVGQRYIIQADIRIGGEQKAFGYVQRGAMAQYVYAGPWVLDGDGVCYLVPIREATGYAEAALVEPWACVEGAYHIPERLGPEEGRVLIVVADETAAADFTGMPVKAEEAVLLGAGHAALAGLPLGLAVSGPPTPSAVREAAGERRFGAIYLVGAPTPELVAACDRALAERGTLCFVCDRPLRDKAAIDIGRVHYELTRFVGAGSPRVRDAFGRNTREDLLPGGKTWMVGAAGPMGQMHVQRALELAEPPRLLFCTDLSEERLDYMRARLRPLAEKKGVRLVCLNVGGVRDVEARVREEAGEGGFDDVYVHAPVAALVEQAGDFLADRSILNIFAGVGIGTTAALSPEVFRSLHTRLIGSSGSSMDDIVNTLEKLESGRLATRMSLAALGGIEATWAGIKGVKENRFPGKTVIFPQVHGVDLTGVDRLAAVSAAAADRLEPGHVWTNGAEAAFLAEKLLF